MTVIKHEWKQHQTMFWIWTAVVVLMNFLIIMMYPQMEGQMEGVNEMFANMGSFTAAFGMNQISISSPLGFYGIEGGSMMGIGGGMLCAILGGIMICKEEASHTAEFLMTMPKKRSSILIQKFITVLLFVIIFYLLCSATALAAFGIIGAEIDMKSFVLYHVAQCFLGIEIASVCFGISAFLSRISFGLPIGVALGLYFLQILVNVTNKVDWLKYITPYHFADAANVIGKGEVDWVLVMLGMVYGIIAIVIGVMYYGKKDLMA